MNESKILIVEDDPNIAKLISYNIETAGFIPLHVDTGSRALKILEEQNIAFVLLDIILPGGMDGLEICKRIKQNPKSKNIPVLMLTAKGEEIDRIVGLELGVDDYVVKPFSPRELILRIKAILKRKTNSNDDDSAVAPSKMIIFKDMKIDSDNYSAYIKDEKIDLTHMEFKLLLTFVSRKDRVQTRDMLLNDVWNLSSSVTTRTVDTHIKKLRKKLDTYGDYIKTIHGVGYKFSEED